MFAVLASAVVALLATPAQATDPAGSSARNLQVREPVRSGFSGALVAGYGGMLPLDVNTDRNATAPSDRPNPLGPALGLRASYTFGPGFVTSANVVNYFGIANGKSSRAMTSMMLELGWAFAVGPAALEPFVGFGATLQRQSTELCYAVTSECTSISESRSETAVNLGLGLTLPVSKDWFLGASSRMIGIVGPELGLSVFATGGFRL